MQNLRARCIGGIMTLVIFVALSFGQGVTLTILHVNDTHSHLDSYGPKNLKLEGTLGGIAKAATVIGTVRATEPNVILLHAGDVFHGDFFYNKYFGVPEFQMMQQLGFDAMAVGNHEFEFGPDVLFGSLSTAFPSGGGIPLLSANCDLTEYPALKPYITQSIIITKYGPKIAIFGMTVPDDPTTMPAPVKIQSEVFTIAGQMVETLKGQGAEVVICLSHLGSMYDKALAANVPGIDVIVGGHDHFVFEQPISITNPLGKQTFILQAGEFYRYVGKLSLQIENGNISVNGYSLLDVDAKVKKVPEIQAIVNQLKIGIEEQYGNVYHKVVGIAVKDLNKQYNPESPLRDTPLGNLVTDACRKKIGTDIALAAHGFISEKMYAGAIVGADVFRSMSYGFDMATGLGFKLVKIKLTGIDIVTGLEATLSYVGLSDDFFMEVSGMKFKYDPTKPVGQRVVLSSLRINGRAINPAGTYTATVNEGIAMLLPMMGVQPTEVEPQSDLEYNVVKDYISHLGIVAYRSEGRIRDISVRLNAGLSKTSEALENEDAIRAKNIPEQFQLNQNYPNPFNPSTTISFDVPISATVSVKIFNLLGQEVTTVVNENLNPGSYRCNFDARGLASGTFIYQLRAGDFVQTKKMILMK